MEKKPSSAKKFGGTNLSSDFREYAKTYSKARVGLGYSGGSISTKDLLQLRFDHARAKDAVLEECNWISIQRDLVEVSYMLSSLAKDRSEYLLRPDLGRQLSDESLNTLRKLNTESYDISVGVADGLSSLAVQKNLIPFYDCLKLEFKKANLKISPLFLVSQGRVASGDQISETLNSKIHIQIIGERPGLTSADSLGVYITYRAKSGTTDERRNCISNVRPDGYSFDQAAKKTMYLVNEALIQKISGVNLKDRMFEISNLERKELT